MSSLTITNNQYFTYWQGHCICSLFPLIVSFRYVQLLHSLQHTDEVPRLHETRHPEDLPPLGTHEHSPPLLLPSIIFLSKVIARPDPPSGTEISCQNSAWRKPLPQVRKPNLHSYRGQDSNSCAWRPLDPKARMVPLYHGDL
ncbi:hypothetical protein E2C01_054392 [Portunus trituberculatus]|uniref:Uncharacterized protein n=1 Tax=Portunus trituberculatus TaxID=210409 RepID=A0A5B7GJA6_PORTR|nr:hypothetical protein [Portunus trituberculatus]